MQIPRTPGTKARLGVDAFLAGSTAGSLDLVYICTFWALRDVGPVKILQSVAAGWVGREAAFGGGAPMAMLGLVSHYAIATVMALAYLLAATRVPVLAKRPFAFGPAYGVALYLAMNFVVVPLSAASTGKPFGWSATDALHLLAHMFFVGTTIALFARRAQRSGRID